MNNDININLDFKDLMEMSIDEFTALVESDPISARKGIADFFQVRCFEVYNGLNYNQVDEVTKKYSQLARLVTDTYIKG